MMKKAAAWLACSVVLVAGVQAWAIENGQKAPSFKATGVDGKEYTLDQLSKGAKATVVCFTCNQCPVAVGYEDRLIDFVKEYKDKGIKFIAINVNTTEDISAMRQRAEEKGFNFPYAYDESGDSARAYGARVTPHLFLVDSDGKVVYQGAFDNSQRSPEKHYLEDAVNAVLKGETPAVSKTDAFGCGIRPKRA